MRTSYIPDAPAAQKKQVKRVSILVLLFRVLVAITPRGKEAPRRETILRPGRSACSPKYGQVRNAYAEGTRANYVREFTDDVALRGVLAHEELRKL